MHTHHTGTPRIEEPGQTNGVRAPGKQEEPLPDGPDQNTEIDDDSDDPEIEENA